MKKIILSLSAIILFASTSFAAETAPQQGNPLISVAMLVGFFAIFWFLLIRPQQKRNKQVKQMLSELSKGDEIVTNGGIMGKIVKLGETTIELEIAENTVIKMQRNAIANVLPKGALKA